MNGHPIESLMQTSMQNIKEMVDVNTILGDPVQTALGSVIIPVSRVSFGFAAGGSQFNAAAPPAKGNNDVANSSELPFGGGSGAGITINPVAFLVVSNTETKLMSVENNQIWDKLLEGVPKILDKIAGKEEKLPVAAVEIEVD